ncbi:hypothetical protein KDJ56_13245 [Brevibacillus composti]|uniref:Uncharacterized protein n=1 Tax=Brevibacillus composti TaxID=2796470 RepID=A0A7T5JMA5_9BACL|nr:hypothetical protein [Brevibacillus composti]QQE72914.1 hypothetical protein JD108_13300 [Brevibacillus composti]QUO39992.1 hypothetical protein KDJ56_13245 [Brevibacillus composti]
MFPRISPIILIILLFAAYGFLSWFFNNPLNALVVIGLSALVIFAVRNYLQTGKFLPGASKPRAAKPKPAPRPPHKKSAQQARKNHPFRVIDGNKGKAKENDGDHDPHNHISQ